MARSIRWVDHGSADYRRAVELRRVVLRLPLGLDFTEDELRDEAGQAHLILEEEGAVVGVLAMVRGSGYAKMRQVAVSPDRQGSGLGRELVLESEAWVRRNGFTEIRLHARLTAVPFYERLGYHVEGDEFLEVGIPHFLMRKLL